MKLSEWFNRNPERRRSQFAGEVRLTPAAITQLCDQKIEPRLRTALAIEDATAGDVTPRDLLKPSEAAQ